MTKQEFLDWLGDNLNNSAEYHPLSLEYEMMEDEVTKYATGTAGKLFLGSVAHAKMMLDCEMFGTKTTIVEV